LIQIESYAFSSCSSLKSITIPRRVRVRNLLRRFMTRQCPT
jgi:hypothetical protein